MWKKKLSKSFFTVGVIILLIGLGFQMTHFSDNPHVLNTSEVATNSILSFEEAWRQKKPVQIVLLGYGGGTHDGAFLTDSIIVIRIDQLTKKIILIPIPRDLWVNLPTNMNGGKDWKINSAYAVGMDDKNFPDKPAIYTQKMGGANMAKTVIGRTIGLPIEKYISLDFQTFADVVDVLGGLDVTVDRTFDDNEYPIDGKETDTCDKSKEEVDELLKKSQPDILPTVFPCRYEKLHFDAGVTHMDGSTALTFVRSRHSSSDGSDFGRSARQRSIIHAMKSKLFSFGMIPKIIPLYKSLQNKVSTDLTMSDLKMILFSISELKSYSVKSISMTDQNILTAGFTPDRQYVLMPKSGMFDWNSLSDWLQVELAKL